MGVIRGILLVFVVCLFFISVFVAGLTLTFSTSLQYDNVKAKLADTIKDFANEQINLDEKFDEVYPVMQLYCQINSEYVFEYGGYTFVIPCDVALQGYDVALDYGIDSAMKEIYYKEYNCNFFDCFEEEGLPLFLISEKSRTFWHNKFYFALLASIILAGLIFLLVQKKSNMPIIAGILIIIASIPFMRLNTVVISFAGSLLGPAADFLSVFFVTSFKVFIEMLIIGGIVLAVGIVLKIFGIGFKVSGFMSKFRKTETSKTKKATTKAKPIKQVKKGK